MITAEIDETHERAATMRGAVGAELVVKAGGSFEAALQHVKPAADALMERLSSLARTPDEIAVEFGIKLNAETGAVIAKASSEANFKISLKWAKAAGPKD